MANQWIDGFDIYNTADIPERYLTGQANCVISNAVARYGGQSLNLGNGSGDGYIQNGYAGSATSFYVGMAVQLLNSGVTGQLFAFSDAGTTVCSIGINAGGSLTIYKGSVSTGTALTGGTTTTGVVNTAGFSYIELAVTLDTTATGSFTIYVNGISAVTGSSIATAVTSTVVTYFQLGGVGGGTSANVYIDDLYVNDNTGSYNNSVLGDSKVLYAVPASAGHESAWTPTGYVTDYECTSEIPPDGDTSYIASNTPGQADLMGISALNGPATIVHAAQVLAFARKDDTVTRAIELVISNGTTDNDGAAQSLTNSYRYYTQRWDSNPFTATTFAVSDFVSLQIGVYEDV